jgi:hypothetical protein
MYTVNTHTPYKDMQSFPFTLTRTMPPTSTSWPVQISAKFKSAQLSGYRTQQLFKILGCHCSTADVFDLLGFHSINEYFVIDVSEQYVCPIFKIKMPLRMLCNISEDHRTQMQWLLQIQHELQR